MPSWKFLNVAATEKEPEHIELQIEGDIIDDEDAWLYEWFGIKATTPNAFKAELANYKGKDVTVRINSYGGSVWAAAGMYNALIDHKATGGRVFTRTDQKAMSAATIPFSAGEVRLMGAVDMLMIHNPLTEVYGYASDLRKVANVLDEVKETIINAYQRATGRSRDKISRLMDGETYMGAKKAMEEGFATGMVEAVAESSPNVSNLMFDRRTILNSTGDALKRMVALQRESPPGNTELEIARARLVLANETAKTFLFRK
jgi:ATP-dependent Clp protease protease subunit